MRELLRGSSALVLLIAWCTTCGVHPARAQNDNPEEGLVGTLPDDPEFDAPSESSEPTQGEYDEDGAAFESDAATSGSDPSTAHLITIAMLIGYGANMDDEATDGLNPFGLGFGARGGYNVGAIYLGGRVTFFLGDSQSVVGGLEISANVFTLGVEGGYDFQIDRFTLRPELGLGIAITSGEGSVSSSVDAQTGAIDSSSEDIYLAPGLTVLHPLTDVVFVAGEVQLPLILADVDTVVGLTLMASVGMGFE